MQAVGTFPNYHSSIFSVDDVPFFPVCCGVSVCERDEGFVRDKHYCAMSTYGSIC